MRTLLYALIGVGCATAPGLVFAQAADQLTAPADAAPEAPSRAQGPPRFAQAPQTQYAAPAAASAASAGGVPVVRFESREPLSVYGVAGSDIRSFSAGLVSSVNRWARICETPCAVPLSYGGYRLAVSARGRSRHEVESLWVRGPTVARLRWFDRADLRIAGALTIVIGLIAGATMTGSALLVGDTWSSERVGVAIGGGGVAVLSILVGASLAAAGDGARARYEDEGSVGAAGP